MRNSGIIVFAICLVLCCGVSWISWDRLSTARAEHVSVIDQRARLAEQVRRWQVLSEQQPDTLFGQRPEADFEQRITATINGAGLPRAARYASSVYADREHRDKNRQPTGMREQTASVEIANLSPSQVGRFLSYWQEEQSLWVPTQIRLTHDQRTENNYTLHLECVAVYHGQGGDPL